MFLAFLDARGGKGAAAMDAAAQTAEASGLRLLATAPGARIYAPEARSPAVRQFGEGFVLGELFHRCAGMTDAPDELPGGRNLAPDAARELLGRYWGRYVALLRAPNAPDWTVLRDPSGGREALIWRQDHVWRVASTLELPRALRPDVRIDWDRVAGLLADPVQVSGALALNGVTALAPGELRALDAPEGPPALLWSPVEIAGREPVEASRAHLVVRDVVSAVSRGLSRPLAEVSGGFDSSVVASALTASRAPAETAWVHHVVDEPEADERDFARATASRLGLQLIERAKPEAALDLAALTALDGLARPSLNATDMEYERAMIALAREQGCNGFVTGQGGDAVFLTLRSAWLGADLVRRRGLTALLDPQIAEISRFSRTSIWNVVRRACLSCAGLGTSAPRAPNPFASRDVRRRAHLSARHPWLSGSDALSPGKRAQLEGLAEALVVQGDCARARAAPLLHPLLTQPVLELCLPIPAYILVHGGRDRAWAREVFCDDLAPLVAQRRTKGDLTAYYGRMVAAALPNLRPFLLHGQLMSHNLLDRERLAGALDPERLAIDGLYADVMDLAAIEAWTRTWPA